MTKRIISLVIIAVTILSVLPMTATAATAGFSDVKPNNWFYNSVNFVADKGLMAGTSGGKFSPTTSMSRAMVVTILWHLEGDPYAYTNELTDVPKNKWFSTPIYWAYRSGVVSGYGNGKFGTNDIVTREQLVTMLKNYTEFKDITTDKRTALTAFSDASAISGWAKEAVTWAVAEGLISGVGNGRLNPKGTASRAEAAAMMMNYYNNILTAVPEVPEQPEQPETPEEPDIDDSVIVAVPKLTESGIAKYDFASNPLVNNEVPNDHVLPSFDIDLTGFVKAGTKLTDLKGKTLKFYYPDSRPAFAYTNDNGTVVDELNWFLSLKSELNLYIKYTNVSSSMTVSNTLRDMNAGKQVDLIYATSDNFPKVFNIARPLNNHVDFTKINDAHGVCNITMNKLRWGGKYYNVSPIGVVDVLWYNKSLANEMCLTQNDQFDFSYSRDPHRMWKNGTWNWDKYVKFLKSVPMTNSNGAALTAFSHWSESLANVTSATSEAGGAFLIDNNATVPTIINNWENPTVFEAWTNVTNINNTIEVLIGRKTESKALTGKSNFFKGQTLIMGTIDPNMYVNTSYSRGMRMDWVPYPTKTAGNGIAHTLGYSMLLPKKTVKSSLVYPSLKFAELWASRFTEAYFDMFTDYNHFSFSEEQKKEYFDYVNQNTVFALPMNNLDGTDGSGSSFYKCFTGDPRYSLRSEHANLSFSVSMHIINSLKYGQ